MRFSVQGFVSFSLLLLLAAPGAEAAKYNNTLHGYSVDYPSWWTIDARTLSDGVRFLMPGSDSIWMQIRVVENPEGQSLEDLLVALLKTLSGTPEALANEQGIATPPPPVVPLTPPTEAAVAEAGTKPPTGTEKEKPPPSIAVGIPPLPVPPAGAASAQNPTPTAPPPPIDPATPIPGPTVRWITLDGAEAWYVEANGQWIIKCLKDGYVYELSANSQFGTMYEWYFGSFFNSFKFQPRLGR